MGQQLSSEHYCVSTMQHLAAELNTTDSQVSECRVLSSSWPGGGGSSVKLQFSWREWHRVSGHLDRVLPRAEQRRLLEHLLLDVTGLRAADLGAVWEAAVGIAVDEGEGVGDGCDGSDEVFPPAEADAAETPSLSLMASGEWTVHPDWSDGAGGGGGNPLLYRDFAKLHLQLGPLFSTFNLDLAAVLATGAAAATAVAAAGDGQQRQDQGDEWGEEPPREAPASPASVAVYGYRADRRRALSGAGVGAQLRGFVAAFVERAAELVRARCAKVGVNFLTTGCQYHPGHNCLVVSGTADVRSLLRQSGGLELRSWANEEAEGQELADQLQRSIGRGFDGLRESSRQRQQQQQQQQQQQHRRYFPMVMYYCDARKLVTVIYGLEPKELTD